MSEMKMGRRNIGAIQDNRIKDKEFAQRVLGVCMEARKLGKKGKPKNVQELEDRIDEYMEICFNAGLPPTVEGMAQSISYDRKTLYNFENDDRDARDDFRDPIKRAKNFIANYDAMLAMSNKLNAAVYCFRGKNMYQMKDVQEIKATSDFNTDPQTPEEIVNALPDVENEEFVEIDKS